MRLTANCTSSLFGRFFVFLLLCSWISVWAQGAAPSAAPDSTDEVDFSQPISEEQAAIALQEQQLRAREAELPRRLQALQNDSVSRILVDEAQADVDTAQLRQDDLQAEISSTERRIGEFKEQIEVLETRAQLLQNTARQDELSDTERAEQLRVTRQDLAERRQDLEQEVLDLKNLRQELKLAAQQLSLAQKWSTGVANEYNRQRVLNLEQDHKAAEARLEQKLLEYEEKAGALRQQLETQGDSLSRFPRLRLKAQSMAADEQVKLAQLDINLFEIETALKQLEILAEDPIVQLENLQEGLELLRKLLSELENHRNSLQSKLSWAEQKQQLVREQRQGVTGENRRWQDEEIELLTQFSTELQTRQDQVKALLARLDIVQTHLTERFRKAQSEALLTREQLPDTIAAWQQLLTDLAGAPRALFYQSKLSLVSAYQAIVDDTNPWRWTGFLALGPGLVILLAVARHGLRRVLTGLEHQPEGSYLGQLVRGSVELLQKNYVAISVLITLLLAVWIFRVPQPGQGIITTVAVLGVSTKLAIDLAGWLLVSPRLPTQRQDYTLYRRCVMAFLIGGVLAISTILAHLSDMPDNVVRVFDWLCMLYLLLINGPVLRARRYYIALLTPHYAGRYWFISLRLLTMCLPVSLLGASLIGLVGYISLAWTIAWYLGVFMLMLAGWWVIRGLLGDLALVLKNYAIAHSSYGLLWTQEIINPLHLALRVLITIAALLTLFGIYGWQNAYEHFYTTWQPLLLAAGFALLGCVALYIAAGYFVAQAQSATGNALIRHTRQPLVLLLPTTAVLLAAPHLTSMEGVGVESIRHFLLLVVLGAMGWVIVSLVSSLEEVVEQRYRLDAKDNFGARRVQTQVRILRRIVVVAVYLIVIAAMLMTFPKIRQLGAGLLASAGVAGLVAGVAARPFLENIIAGIQIGLTQPIRIDDVVIVEGEWGKIAEINATYVVVRIWDQRRLVVPLNYFNTQPFQNWTRTSSDLLGTAFFYVDYTFPVAEGRQELQRILDDSDLWDGKVCVLQVTDATAQTMEIRALMSAADASIAWDLRCLVREKFIEFLQREYPDALPKTRAVLAQGAVTSQLPHTPHPLGLNSTPPEPKLTQNQLNKGQR
ncbi:MAG: mechanosensitive ion channel domain-containing protein [Candidatus Competibacteraceae bacterium]|jgi:small-conductance mechanosensitive channel|nr:mechanosensitive ion channel domain-containing protein [Candidatus Competibacteraceae bacterium]